MVKKKGWLRLAQINIFVFISLKGIVIVSFCMKDEARAAAAAHFGIDIMYVGIASIIMGSAIIAGISAYIKKNRL